MQDSWILLTRFQILTVWNPLTLLYRDRAEHDSNLSEIIFLLEKFPFLDSFFSLLTLSLNNVYLCRPIPVDRAHGRVAGSDG